MSFVKPEAAWTAEIPSVGSFMAHTIQGSIGGQALSGKIIEEHRSRKQYAFGQGFDARRGALSLSRHYLTTSILEGIDTRNRPRLSYEICMASYRHGFRRQWAKKTNRACRSAVNPWLPEWDEVAG